VYEKMLWNIEHEALSSPTSPLFPSPGESPEDAKVRRRKTQFYGEYVMAPRVLSRQASAQEDVKLEWERELEQGLLRETERQRESKGKEKKVAFGEEANSIDCVY
jgi:hypothetical protein